jgi:hypothetical protein
VPNRKPSVKLGNPEQPEARDKAPRLVDLANEEETVDTEKLSHYMRLADLALAQPLEERKKE